MNVGQLIPITRNNQQSNDSMKKTKVRPITISDSLLNIFEKYTLEMINKTVRDNKFQFGFTNKSFTQHAMFTLKETV